MRSHSVNSRYSVSIMYLVIISTLASCGTAEDIGNDATDSAQPESAPSLSSESVSVSLSDEEAIRVERGFLTVLENRAIDGSPTIRIGYYRLKSNSDVPATPIFVLPGGPGSSWIQQIESVIDPDNPGSAADRTFFQEHIIEDLRSIADVVIVDQRGAGISQPKLTCNSKAAVPLNLAVTPATFSVAATEFTNSCLAELANAGRDIEGYTVFELTDDINELRKAFGYPKISLFAGSFGSQWSLAFIKRYEEVVERFVFWGIEGLDHAYDSPTGVLNAMAAAYDDMAATTDDGAAPFRDQLSATLDALRRSTSLDDGVPEDDGSPPGEHFGPAELQRALYGSGNFSVRDRQSIGSWFSYVTSLFEMNFSDAMPIARQFGEINRPGNPVPQYLSIDCGLSISETRRKRIEAEVDTALIGNVNFRYDVICANWPAIDVGDSFRAPKTSILPGLMFHGTWDVSTPLSNAEEVSRLFPNSQLTTVERATHKILRELYREKPEVVRPIIRDFLSGRDVDAPERIELPPIPATR